MNSSRSHLCLYQHHSNFLYHSPSPPAPLPPVSSICYPLSFKPFGSLLSGLHLFYWCIIIVTRHYYYTMLVIQFYHNSNTRTTVYDQSLSYISILKCANVLISKYMFLQVSVLELSEDAGRPRHTAKCPGKVKIWIMLITPSKSNPSSNCVMSPAD